MAKLLLNVLKLSPVVLAATFFVSNGAFAAEQKVTSVDELAQVTSVDSLSDIQPSHWAYQSVESLVERYGCVAGYPDGTYRGNRSMTRYEFAALLNGCLDRITELIAASSNNSTSTTDMAAVNALRDEFSAELATLRGKVDGLDYRVSELEGANKFSTTAKLKGKVEFITGAAFGNDVANDQITFGQRTRLDISSSFTGKDKLRVRLHQRDNSDFGSKRTGTNMSRIDVQGDTNGAVEVEKLNYNFKPSKNISASVWALGAGMDDFLDADKAKVQTTRFAKRNPLTHRSNSEDQGAGATIKFNKNVNLQVGYTTKNGNEFGTGKGIGGSYDLGTQLNLKAGGFKIGASYVRSEGSAGTDYSHKTGSSAASLFTGSEVSSDSFGIQASKRFGKKTKLGAWYGLTNVNEGGTSNEATLQNWAVFASIKDFAKKGNVLGMTFGMPPKVTSGTNEETNGTSYLLDVTYRHKVTDRLSLQPGVYAVFNPNHTNSNDTVYGAVLNTTFKF
ncbi:MAG: carbohydrate porin [Rivularia sp. (in: Bacteria)]|nr:carbohydrate porin [Rivularia sp. MS3]